MLSTFKVLLECNFLWDLKKRRGTKKFFSREDVSFLEEGTPKGQFGAQCRVAHKALQL